MSSNFGRLDRDIIGCNYFVLGSKIIDCDRNVFVCNVNAKQFIGNLIGNVQAKLIQEQNTHQGITVAGNVRFSENANIAQDLSVCGTIYTDSIESKGNILEITNLVSDTIRANVIVANVVRTKELTSNVMTSNIVNATSICANVDVQTRYLKEKEDGGEINVVGNLVLDANSMVKGILCGNLYTHNITRKEANVEIQVDGNLVLNSNSYFKGTVCGNLNTHRITKKTANVEIQVEGNLVLDANSMVKGHLCGNLDTFEINEKSPGNGIFITGNVDISGGIILPKGSGTLSNIVANIYQTQANIDSPAGTIATTNTLDGSYHTLSVKLNNYFISSTSIVLVNVRDYNGTACPVLGRVKPYNGNATIEIKDVNGALDGDLVLSYLVIC